LTQVYAFGFNCGKRIHVADAFLAEEHHAEAVD
jgi:hypothetical protein